MPFCIIFFNEAITANQNPSKRAIIGDHFKRIPATVKESEVILISAPHNVIQELVEELGDVPERF